MSSAIAVQPVESKSDSRPYILPKRLAEPSLREVLLLAIAASVLFLLAAIRMGISLRHGAAIHDDGGVRPGGAAGCLISVLFG
jgi:hypothetical protein